MNHRARISVSRLARLRRQICLSSLPVLVVMKAALHNAMIATGTRKSDLARSMGMKGPQIDRLLDVCHSSKVETVELALQQLNRTVQISVNKVAA